jgi:hypothetical protein
MLYIGNRMSRIDTYTRRSTTESTGAKIAIKGRRVRRVRVMARYLREKRQLELEFNHCLTSPVCAAMLEPRKEHIVPTIPYMQESC